MKFRSAQFTTLCAALLCLAFVGRASASQMLVDQTSFLSGQQSYVEAFNILGPGTLTVSLTNVAWPQSLASLGMVLSSASGLLAPVMGEGTSSIKVGSGMLYAQWFGTAQGPLDTGVYSLEIEFESSATAVPLPTSLLLLLSGLTLLVWQRRQRAAAPGGDAVRYS
jgi:hypothetical protein